jgi:hypothetical protein
MRKLLLLVATTAAIAVMAVVGLDAQNPAVANPGHEDGGFRSCPQGENVVIRAKTVGQTTVSSRHSTYNFWYTEAKYGTNQEVRTYHIFTGDQWNHWAVTVDGQATNGPKHWVDIYGTYAYCT